MRRVKQKNIRVIDTVRLFVFKDTGPVWKRALNLIVEFIWELLGGNNGTKR